MSKTKIEWAQYTWSPIRGCTPVSAGCDNCYAEKMAKRFNGKCDACNSSGRIMLEHPGCPQCNGTGKNDEYFKPAMIPERLEEPLHWKKPRMVFVGSMGDLFHDDITDSFILEVFEVMAKCKQHTFQILTKRPKRMKNFINKIRYVPSRDSRDLTGALDYVPNVWLGVTAENQKAADERIPLLLQTPAALRFVSCEPLLENINPILKGTDARIWTMGWKYISNNIDWVIVGGETGPNARECHEKWVKEIYEQCEESKTPFFFKAPGHKWVPTCIGNDQGQDCDSCLGLNCTYGTQRWRERREWPNGR
jgi:protein gp37